ncbi:Receptor-like protein kinase HERK 1 [Acorus gramineus]|uniref:Receptor-like protein kinase HERK 1 n=1 Tax=Acorus gramineus TaxID=55184 RepID=A0AAV9B2I9_ACOGR|nr:Receptor-like protein kinase HERK 1 [Acorus gramineus]
MHTLFLLVTLISFLGQTHIAAAYTPVNNYLIDCGSPTNTSVFTRTFVADNPSSSWTLSAPKSILANTTTTSNAIASSDTPALYQTARIFTSSSSYTFPIQNPGRHWVRLYFFPFTYQTFNLANASFTILAQDTILLNSNQLSPTNATFKEFSLIIGSGSFALSFSPLGSSIAYVNAIEVVSVPDDLIMDNASTVVPPPVKYKGLATQTLETIYRINMGGPKVFPSNDTLSRTWVPDQGFLLQKNLAKSVPYSGTINYNNGGSTEDTAPDMVYSTATEMAQVSVANSNFNVTWEFSLRSGSTYLVRTHFCDIVSTALNTLYFNLYIETALAIRDLDLSTIAVNTLASPVFMDFIVKVTDGSGKFRISVGPSLDIQNVIPNAILNGLEIMRLSGADASTTGTASKKGNGHGVILGVVFGVLAVVIVMALVLCVMWRRRKTKRRQSKTWFPISTTNGVSQSLGSRFSNGTVATAASSAFYGNLNFRFPFAALQEATNNFDESCVIGVGGFGRVYKGVLRDATKVAVKRGNPRSQQGLTEFRTEIEMLSNFRHRHLVSLIGYCDEGSEMVLVYEYMEEGTLKSHLYGCDLPNLTWKQRLEICIGAARGLHYLHTGSAKAIIHRDVKSANILLDEHLMAKVADFGLSKTGPELDQTHVSTAVKGSFGYLDPEYFRRQQLTEKSDVYSFGVVLLETLCARPVIDPTLPREMVNLAEWAMKWLKKGQVEQIMDARLVGDVRGSSLRKFAEMAEKCLADYGVDRPAMGDVLWNLEYALQLQEAAVAAAAGDGNAEEDSTNRIPELAPRIELAGVDLESMTVFGEESSPGEDLSGVSKVFSQLVKSEGR